MDKDRRIKELELENELLKIQLNELKNRVLGPEPVKVNWINTPLTPTWDPMTPVSKDTFIGTGTQPQQVPGHGPSVVYYQDGNGGLGHYTTKSEV